MPSHFVFLLFFLLVGSTTTLSFNSIRPIPFPFSPQYPQIKEAQLQFVIDRHFPPYPCSSFLLPSCIACTPLPLRHSSQCIVDDCLRFLQDAAQMIRSPKALRINLVDILGS